MAVYGSRNPHRCTDLLTPKTAPLASDLYGCHKLEAENIVRSSGLEWSILRLSGVTTLEPFVDYGNSDSFYLGAIMPEDNRCHTVDARDVAAAFAAAVTTDSVREVFMIGGDDSHKRLYGEVARANAEAMGLGALLPRSRPAIPTVTSTGIRWTGWTPPAHSRCCPSSGTPVGRLTTRFVPGWVGRCLRCARWHRCWPP